MSVDKELISSFLLACSEGDLEIVKLFLRNNTSLINCCNGIKETPLHLAVRSGNTSIVEELLRCGADPNLKSTSGQTPLHIAKKKGFDHLVETLLFFNAKSDNESPSLGSQKKIIKPRSKTTNFGDPSILVVGPNKSSMVVSPDKAYKNSVIFNAGKGAPDLSPLFSAVLKNQLRKVKELLRLKKVDVNEVYHLYDSKTALHVASEEGHVEIADILIRFGANIEAEDYFNKTPLHLAIWAGHKKVVLLLLDCGANVNHTDASGNSPLHFCQKDEVLQVLLQFGANINALNISGSTFLNAQSFSLYPTTVLHLEKLNLLNSHIHQKMLKKLAGVCLLERLNNSYLQPMKQEIKHMQNIIFDYRLGLTVYDFLFLDENSLATYAENKVLRSLYREGWFEIEFPNYGYLLTLKYKMAKKRNNLLKSAKLIMRKVTEDSFPDICYDKILKNLSSSELKVLAEEI